MSSVPATAESNSVPRRFAVVGGGITGLAAAHRIIELATERGERADVVLFEASSRTGGVFGTMRMGEYLIETGADSFITNKPWGVDLCRRLGLESRLIPTDGRYRRSLVLRKGKPVPVPDGFMLLAPARMGPIMRSNIFSPWGKIRLAMERFIPRRRDPGDESLGSFVRRRFGREALHRLVQPLVGGIYTSDPWKLSLEATMPRFLEMERRHGSLIKAMQVQADEPRHEQESQAAGARYGLFTTLANGMSELLDALEQRIAAHGAVRRNAAVISIRPAHESNGAGANIPSRWDITLADGTHETFDGVVLATRAPIVAELIRGLDAPLATLLANIEYASSAIVVTGHKLADIAHPLDAFGLVIPYAERRKILAVSFTSRKFPNRAPEGHAQLRTFVGGAMQPELMHRSDDQLIELALKELRSILGVRGKEDFAVVCRYVNAMPQYYVGHVDRIREIEMRAAQHAGLALAGNAYHGVGVPDCIHSAEQAAERVLMTAQGGSL
ncbi:MAG: protoporphyrinogen oxidase [Planctomycetaceae bacterium]|nr:protoporphyrinogen oxidase [Planctomycetaceae bacterium]